MLARPSGRGKLEVKELRMPFKMNAELALNSSFLDEYRRLLSHFAGDILRINTMIYQLKEIQKFPFKDLYLSSFMIFFGSVQKSYMDLSVLSIYRILYDTEKGVVTLPSFKNRILRNIPDSLVLRDFKLHLKTEFKISSDKDMKERFRAIRNNIIAHTSEDLVLGNSTIDSITWNEFYTMIESVNESFLSLSFNEYFQLLPLEYDQKNIELNRRPGSKSLEPDVKSLLNLLGLSSHLAKSPLSDLVFLRDTTYRKKFSESFKHINRFRKLAGVELIPLDEE